METKSQLPWRDGSDVLYSPDQHGFPPICVITGDETNVELADVEAMSPVSRGKVFSIVLLFGAIGAAFINANRQNFSFPAYVTRRGRLDTISYLLLMLVCVAIFIGAFYVLMTSQGGVARNQVNTAVAIRTWGSLLETKSSGDSH